MPDLDAASAPVDIPHLRTLTMSDPVIEREVLALFGDRAASALKAIIKADAPGRRREAAHRLAGAARAIGAWQLAAVAGEIELQEGLTTASAEALSQAMSEVVDYVTLRLAS
jgi:HPt (histidine-containing phosphotransfer) domain-containing protein